MMAQITDLAQGWLAYFAPLVLQNTVFLGAVFLALYFLRHASARIQHAVAAVGLVKLALPAFIPTSWFAGTAPVGSAEEISTFLFSFTGPGERVAAGQSLGLGALLLIGALILWLVVVQVRLVRAGFQTFDLVRKLGSARPVRSGRIQDWADKRQVQVLRSEWINLPLTCGLLPGRIFVPAAWEDWSDSQRQAVVRHEMAHLRRKDGFFQGLEIFVQAVYFFHPLVWLLVARMRVLREMACDDACIERDKGTSTLVYSRFLVEMAETILDPPLASESASTLMRRKNELLRRVSYLVKEEKMVTVPRKRLGLTLAVLILLIIPLSMYQATAQKPAPEKAQKAEQAAKEKEIKKAKMDEKSDQAKKEKMIKAAKGEKGPEVQIALVGQEILVNGKKCNHKKFQQALKEATGGQPEFAVARFKCGDDVSMAKLHKVQQQMQEVGMAKVVYADAKTKGVPLMLPNKDHAKKLAQLGKKDLARLQIAKDGALSVDGDKIKTDKCGKYLEQRLAENPNLVVQINCEGDTRYEDFVTTLAMVKGSGAKRIAVNDPEL